MLFTDTLPTMTPASVKESLLKKSFNTQHGQTQLVGHMTLLYYHMVKFKVLLLCTSTKIESVVLKHKKFIVPNIDTPSLLNHTHTHTHTHTQMQFIIAEDTGLCD